MNDDARDPYVGLNDYFGRKAAGAVPAWYAVGRVISTTPLKIRADGLDLDIEDLGDMKTVGDSAEIDESLEDE